MGNTTKRSRATYRCNLCCTYYRRDQLKLDEYNKRLYCPDCLSALFLVQVPLRRATEVAR